MADQSHKVTITVQGRYPHGGNQFAEVSIGGDGGLEHMLDAFRAALVAAGFAAQTAQALQVGE